MRSVIPEMYGRKDREYGNWNQLCINVADDVDPPFRFQWHAAFPWNLAFLARGKKDWDLLHRDNMIYIRGWNDFGTGTVNPLNKHLFDIGDVPMGDALKEVLVTVHQEAGDVLFLPPWTLHGTKSITEPGTSNETI